MANEAIPLICINILQKSQKFVNISLIDFITFVSTHK